MTNVQEFFDRYARALTEVEVDTLADLYDYPSLAVTRQGSLAITEPDQTRGFFIQNAARYAERGIVAVRIVEPVASYDERGLWVGLARLENLDDGGALVDTEHNAYQLVDRGQGWRIAVTTPLDAS